jgi:hypothetical protein
MFKKVGSQWIRSVRRLGVAALPTPSPRAVGYPTLDASAQVTAFRLGPDGRNVPKVGSSAAGEPPRIGGRLGDRSSLDGSTAAGDSMAAGDS